MSGRVAALAAEAVLPLVGATDPVVAGQKAARLARLLGAGFAVPDGWVIPVSTGAAWADRGEVLAAGIAHPEGGGAWAVRSSAAAEDLADASFAGAYRTVLGVSGTASLRAAVADVIASGAAPHAPGRASGAADDPRMAVLVQRLVDAESAGVAFSADPLNGDRDVVVVHAVAGRGDALVSGEADPEEWTVRAVPTCLHGRGVLSADQAQQVASLARRVEAALGAPVDIEWAYEGEKLWLLQARPITALPLRPDLEDLGPGTWLKDVAHYPEPLSPFGASLHLPALAVGVERAFDEFGLLVSGLEIRTRGGEVYGKVRPVGGDAKPGAAPPPAWFLGLLARLHPALRRRMRNAEQALNRGLLAAVPRDWEARLRDRFQAATDALLDEALEDLDDAALLGHLARARALLERGQVAHFRLFIPYCVAIAELVVGCRELLGWDTADTLRLLCGLSTASSAPTRALDAIAEQLRDRPADRAAIAAMRDLSDLPTDLARTLQAFIDRHGWRTINYDPGAPTLAERPLLIAQLVRDRLEAAQPDPGRPSPRETAENRARAALVGRPRDRARFDALLRPARRCYPQREENIALTDCAPCGLLRRAMLEIGRRLVERGQLRRPDAARFLSVDELEAALRGVAQRDIGALTARREAEARWVRAHPGPDVIGPAPGPFPDPRWLPSAGRRLNRAFLWMMDQELTPPVARSGASLRGRPGSPGRVDGLVRIVRSEADFGRLRPGEILVCPITSPVWSVLFGLAAGLITDAGGAMSHAAIIAREHDIPAVLATGHATRTLRDGERVTVDGTAGVVRRHDAT